MNFECSRGGADRIRTALEWKFIGMFDLTAGIKKEIQIPSEANEILAVAGFKNFSQVYGGVSAVLPKSKNSDNILYFEDIYEATGNLAARGAYFFYEGNVLKISVKEIVPSATIAVRVYYR